jgi:hypothetical protein
MRIKSFFNTYVVTTDNDEDYLKPPFYLEKLREIVMTEQYVLDLDCDHLY